MGVNLAIAIVLFPAWVYLIGAAAAVISKALGHVSPQSARAYVHLDVEPARAAIDKALGMVCDAP